MTPQEYSDLAIRTECNQSLSRHKIGAEVNAIRLLHSAVGISGEAGEIASETERYIYYGQELDPVNLMEEYGDLLWYINQGCRAIGVTLEQVMEANISKLTERFPQKYQDYLAAEENRNREKEREVLEKGYIQSMERSLEKCREQTGAGWAEPPEDTEAGHKLGAEYEHIAKMARKYREYLDKQEKYGNSDRNS